MRYFRPEQHGERHWLGPLTEPRLLLVFVTTFGLTMGFGLLEVGYPGYATALAAPAFGGVLLSLNSFGSALSGAIFGGLALRAPIERQYTIATGLMAVPLLLHYFVDAQAAFAFVAFLAGAAIAPSIACQSVLVSRLAPSRYATEAFTWSSTFIVSGLGAGMAVGGWLIETKGAKSPFLAGAAHPGRGLARHARHPTRCPENNRLGSDTATHFLRDARESSMPCRMATSCASRSRRAASRRIRSSRRPGSRGSRKPLATSRAFSRACSASRSAPVAGERGGRAGTWKADAATASS